MIHPQDPLYVATRMNSAHIEKLRDISCLILRIGADRQTVIDQLLEDINDAMEYMEIPITVTEEDLVESGDGSLVYDSDELEDTYELRVYLGDYIQVV